MGNDPSLNALDLQGHQTRPVLRFGTVDVSFAARHATTTEGLNQLSTAQLELDYGLTSGQPVDYLAPVTVGMRDGEQEHALFVGAVTEAQPDGPIARVAALTAPEMTETAAGVFVGINVIAPEVMHLMARAAGLPEERIRIDELDQLLPVETIEVVAPLHGIHVTQPVAIGNVTIVPARTGERALAGIEQSDATSEFQGADAHAVVVRVGRRMLDVESDALAEIDTALAWLAVRSRYGLATMPDGQPQPFRRDRARAKPRRGSLVVVRGLLHGRTWFRTPEASEVNIGLLPIDQADQSWLPPGNITATVQSRQALLACARAASESDPLTRIQALWEAIEFYVTGINPPRLFDKAEAKRIRRSLPGDLDPALRERALKLLEKINEPPLLARLDEAIRQDGVPIAPSELILLGRLRKTRNDAVHGREPVLPTRDEIAHAVSVVSRMLIYRISRRHEDGGAAGGHPDD